MNLSRFIRAWQGSIKEEVLSRKNSIVRSKLRWISISASISENSENLIVKYNKITNTFPLVWLRDNCTCEKCFHQSSQSRIINWKDFDINVKAASVQVENEEAVRINWDDNHKSVYTVDWLEKRSFQKNKQDEYLNTVYIPPQKTWNKNEFFDIMQQYEYKEVINNDEVLHNMLTNLAVYGITLIKNVPENQQECRKLTEKIAFPKKTHYGEDFQVFAKEGTSNVAYLSSSLHLHTDLPYYDYQPGVIFLHCIVQTLSTGGGNLLTDAFYVSDKLRQENKEAFDILTKTEVNWLDIGEEDGVKFHKIHRDPVISLDRNGNIKNVRHSIPQRDSYFTVNIEYVKYWYRALKVFVDELSNSAAHFKTQPGDILCLDNRRLVHGRLAYTDKDNIKRLLAGNYIDWDEIYSKLRILGDQLTRSTK